MSLGSPVLFYVRVCVVDVNLDLVPSFPPSFSSSLFFSKMEQTLKHLAQFGDLDKMSPFLARQDVDVNWQDRFGNTALYEASWAGHDTMVAALLAHPRIDVNIQTDEGSTAFMAACRNWKTSCVRLLLRDPRVDVNLPDSRSRTPLFWTAYFGYEDITQWLIASERDLDFGMSDSNASRRDLVSLVREKGRFAVASLLERYLENPALVIFEVQAQLGFPEAVAAELFALVVLVSDYFLQGKVADDHRGRPLRFFELMRRLPMELQMVICNQVTGSMRTSIPGKDIESGIKSVVRKLRN